jgi:hypothetical protein
MASSSRTAGLEHSLATLDRPDLAGSRPRRRSPVADPMFAPVNDRSMSSNHAVSVGVHDYLVREQVA